MDVVSLIGKLCAFILLILGFSKGSTVEPGVVEAPDTPNAARRFRAAQIDRAQLGGEAARRQAAARFDGEADFYSWIATILNYRPGSGMDPREDHVTMGRIENLCPAIYKYLRHLGATDLSIWRNRIAEQGGLRLPGKADSVGAYLFPAVEEQAAAWVAEQPDDDEEDAGGYEHVPPHP